MAWEFEQKPLVAKPKVCVCIPHTGTISLEWADRTYVPLKLLVSSFDKVYQLHRGSPLNLSRELMVRGGLKIGENGDVSKVTHFFFVDTDILFEKPVDVNKAIATLLSLNSPIACGLYRAKQKTGFHYAIWNKRVLEKGKFDLVGIPPAANWFPVDITGLGCALIKREVFEKIPRPWFEWTFSKEDPDAVGMSEDFSFFTKAKAHGYTCWIFSDVKCSHIGIMKVKFDGDFSTLEI